MWRNEDPGRNLDGPLRRGAARRHLSWHVVSSADPDIPEQFRIRRDKRARLLAEGRDPYPVAIERTHTLAEVRAAIQELPPNHRAAVLMHKYQGMDYRQIGDVLKLSESATKSLLFRAYQTLRDKLKDFV